jgi:peptidoglycan/LPS O-acetylase OafA/YrhL
VGPLVIGLPLSVSVLGLYWGSRIGAALLANRVVYFLGLISYSLYLWHFVVMQQLPLLVGDQYAEWPHWVTFPLVTLTVVVVASLSYYLVERPFYRLRSYRQLKEP